MTCEAFEEMISVLLDGELTLSEKERLQSHLQDCKNCNSVLTTMQNLRGFFRCESETLLTDDFDERFFTKLLALRFKDRMKPQAQPWWRRKLMVPIPVALAAITVIFCLVGLSLFWKKPIQIVPTEHRYIEKPSQNIRKIKITDKDIIAVHHQNKLPRGF